MNNYVLVFYGSYRSNRMGIRLAEYIVKRLRNRGDDIELVDEHFGRLEVGRCGAAIRRGNAAQHKKNILRMHHDKLDEFLCQFTGLPGVGGLYFCHRITD